MRWFLMSEVPLYRCWFKRYRNLRSLWATLITQSYRGTSLIRNNPPVGPYCSPPPKGLWLYEGGGLFLMSEVPLYFARFTKLLSGLYTHSPSTGPLASLDGAASAPLSAPDRVYSLALS